MAYDSDACASDFRPLGVEGDRPDELALELKKGLQVCGSNLA